LLIYNDLFSENRCLGQGSGIGLRSLPSLALKLLKKILNVARQPQVPTYASNTSSGQKYLVWNIVKNCQDTALRRAPLPRVQFQVQQLDSHCSEATWVSGRPELRAH
jgi:hypothetical protein